MKKTLKLAIALVMLAGMSALACDTCAVHAKKHECKTAECKTKCAAKKHECKTDECKKECADKAAKKLALKCESYDKK